MLREVGGAQLRYNAFPSDGSAGQAHDPELRLKEEKPWLMVTCFTLTFDWLINSMRYSDQVKLISLILSHFDQSLRGVSFRFVIYALVR